MRLFIDKEDPSLKMFFAKCNDCGKETHIKDEKTYEVEEVADMELCYLCPKCIPKYKVDIEVHKGTCVLLLKQIKT